MAHGRFGAAKPAAATPDMLFTGQAGKVRTATVRGTNQSTTTAALVRVALMDATTVGAVAIEDYIFYDFEVPAGKPFGESGIVVAEGQGMLVQSDTGNVSFVGWGMEDPT